ncbi:MAG: hypothetical protein ABIP06_11920 [Pyrinomonadaceae bacterium]
MLFGYLIGIAIFSAISAFFLKISAKLVVKKSVGFTAAFVISIISFLAALFIQDLTAHKQQSFWAVLPGIVFFLTCWLLNINFVKYGQEDESIGYAKSFLITLVQCIALFTVVVILSFMIISGLMHFGNQTN